MTRRYAHLRDETPKKAAALAVNIIEITEKNKDQNNEAATAWEGKV